MPFVTTRHNSSVKDLRLEGLLHAFIVRIQQQPQDTMPHFQSAEDALTWPCTCCNKHRFHTRELLPSPVAKEKRLSRYDGVPKTFRSRNEIRGGPEPTDISWHENILHNKKGMSWNTPVSSTKQAVYCLFVSFGRSTSSRWPPPATFCQPDVSQNCQKLGAAALYLWSQFRS